MEWWTQDLLPLDEEASRVNGFTTRDYSQGYSLEAPNYFRTDFRINYRLNKPKYSAIISLDLQNMTNRINVFDYYFSSSSNEIVPSEQLGLIPVLNFRVEF